MENESTYVNPIPSDNAFILEISRLDVHLRLPNRVDFSCQFGCVYVKSKRFSVGLMYTQGNWMLKSMFVHRLILLCVGEKFIFCRNLHFSHHGLYKVGHWAHLTTKFRIKIYLVIWKSKRVKSQWYKNCLLSNIPGRS